MIAVESFRRFRFRDIMIISVIAFLWALVGYVVNFFVDPQSSYIISLLIATLLMSFTVHLVRKAGSATLFYVIGGLLMFSVNDLGITHVGKIWMLFIAGIVFELFFIVLKLEVRNVQLDIVLGTGFSAASIPFSTGFILSSSLAMSLISDLFNIALLSFFVGVIGAVLSFLIWHRFRTNKSVLRYEYMP